MDINFAEIDSHVQHLVNIRWFGSGLRIIKKKSALELQCPPLVTSTLTSSENKREHLEMRRLEGHEEYDT